MLELCSGCQFSLLSQQGYGLGTPKEQTSNIERRTNVEHRKKNKCRTSKEEQTVNVGGHLWTYSAAHKQRWYLAIMTFDVRMASYLRSRRPLPLQLKSFTPRHRKGADERSAWSIEIALCGVWTQRDVLSIVVVDLSLVEGEVRK